MISTAYYKVLLENREKPAMDFLARQLEADKAHKTQEAGFYVWGSSVIRYKDNYYYFGNKWSDVDGFQGWVHYNRVCIGQSSNLTGPFTPLTEISVLRSQPWAADMTTNPQVFWWGGKYWLFYVGSTYSSVTYPVSSSEARANQKIGVAYADTPIGPWIPSTNNPIVVPEAGTWEENICNNPSVTVAKDGKLRMVYKSDYQGSLRMGIAEATHPEGPWTGRTVTPNFNLAADSEDPNVWKENGKWYAIAKIFEADVEIGASANDGVLLESVDGVNYSLAENAHAWNRNISWTDATNETFLKMERPFVYVENGRARAFFAAIDDGVTSFNIGIPLSGDVPATPTEPTGIGSMAIGSSFIVQ